MKSRLAIVPAIVLLGVLALATASAGVYMKIDGIEGDTAAGDGHKDWIVIESLSTSMNVAPAHAATGTGAQRRRGDAVVEDISVTKHADKASPKLSEAVCKGKVFPKVEIHVTSSYTDAGRQTYYKYELKNVMVTSYSVNASGSGGGDRPVENVTLNFEEVKVTYDQKGMATKGGNAETTWKVEKGEK